MPHEDGPFEEQARRFAGSSYEIEDPKAEITDDQQAEFIKRCENILPPSVPVVGPAITSELFEEMMQQGFTAKDVEEVKKDAEDHASLDSELEFNVFGSRVYLASREGLDTDEKEVRLEVTTDEVVDAKTYSANTTSYSITYKLGEVKGTPFFEEDTRNYDRKTRKENYSKFMQLYSRGRESGDLTEFYKAMRAAGEEAERTGANVFTQERWVQAMIVLDIIKILQDHGVNSTEESDYDNEED